MWEREKREKICCLVGDSFIFGEKNLVKKIVAEAEVLIKEHGVTNFIVNGNGAFDKCARKALMILADKYNEIEVSYGHLFTGGLFEEVKRIAKPGEKYHSLVAMHDSRVKENYKNLKLRLNYEFSYYAANMICYSKWNVGIMAKTLKVARDLENNIINLYNNKKS